MGWSAALTELGIEAYEEASHGLHTIALISARQFFIWLDLNLRGEVVVAQEAVSAQATPALHGELQVHLIGMKPAEDHIF